MSIMMSCLPHFFQPPHPFPLPAPRHRLNKTYFFLAFLLAREGGGTKNMVSDAAQRRFELRIPAYFLLTRARVFRKAMAYPLAYWALAQPIAAVGGGGGGVMVVDSHKLGLIASNHKTGPECPRFDRGTKVPLPRSLGACFATLSEHDF